MVSELHVEVVQESESYFSKAAVIILAETFLQTLGSVIPGNIYLNKDFNITEDLDDELRNHVTAVIICDTKHNKSFVNVASSDIKFYVYKLNSRGFNVESMETGCDLLHNEEMPVATHWGLPAKDFFGLWESLIYDSFIKKEILNFAQTTLLYSDNCINSNLVSLNRVILLHGPPGTGKTALCKALAQKLSIRLGDRYKTTQLVEINSHSLFSKWFSESGKLVMRMFEKLHTLAKKPDILVCVLIDEVESLTHARTAAFSGSDPSDSVRVVNAILTQLDLIKQYPNVFIMTTSNITGAIDLAFVDRADIKQYIGPPTLPAIYQIYLSSIEELISKKIIIPSNKKFMSYKLLEENQFELNAKTSLSLDLLALAQNSVGLSGRSLRKVPLIAHALYIETVPVDVRDFFDAMNRAVARQKLDTKFFG